MPSCHAMCSIQIHLLKTFPSTSISQTSFLQVTFQFGGLNLNYDYIRASNRRANKNRKTPRPAIFSDIFLKGPSQQHVCICSCESLALIFNSENVKAKEIITKLFKIIKAQFQEHNLQCTNRRSRFTMQSR